MQRMLRGQFNDLIVELAAKDEEFRKELLANPREALAKVLTNVLPESVSVTVLEEAPDTIHLILPAKVSATTELTDAEVANVAGGAERGSAYRGGWFSFEVQPNYLTPIQLPGIL